MAKHQSIKRDWNVHMPLLKDQFEDVLILCCY